MRIVLDNIGVIRHAEMEIKDITIICGKNNTGKTYATYAYYGFLDFFKNELTNSEKDISENLMIVDLLRNDLGKYAKIGTVKTPKRFAIESFKNVHHMVSTITAELNNSHSLTVLFGGMTGNL